MYRVYSCHFSTSLGPMNWKTSMQWRPDCIQVASCDRTEPHILLLCILALLLREHVQVLLVCLTLHFDSVGIFFCYTVTLIFSFVEFSAVELYSGLVSHLLLFVLGCSMVFFSGYFNYWLPLQFDAALLLFNLSPEALSLRDSKEIYYFLKKASLFFSDTSWKVCFFTWLKVLKWMKSFWWGGGAGRTQTDDNWCHSSFCWPRSESQVRVKNGRSNNCQKRIYE